MIVGEGVSRLVGCPHVDAKFSNNSIQFLHLFFVPRDIKLIKILFTFDNNYVQFQAF